MNRPKRCLSQNFLVDPNTARAIVDAARIGPSDYVLEIGPGRGMLTDLIAAAAKCLVAIELDDELAQALRAGYADASDDVRVIHADFLEVDLPALLGSSSRWAALGNLPYGITTPILLKLLDHPDLFSRAVLMVQREVAERWSASPGGKAYGAVTVWCQYRCEVRLVRRVSASCFRPQPKVESAVVELTFRDRHEPEARDIEFLQHIVRSAFNQRRKRAVNSLSARAGLEIGREELEALFAAIGIDRDARAEHIAVGQYVELANALRPEGRGVDVP